MILKKLLGTALAGVLAAVAAGAFLGFDSTLTSAAAWRNRIREALEESKSDLQQAAEIGVQIEALQEERARFGRKLAVIEVTLEDDRAKAERLEADLAREEDLLSRCRFLLDSPKDKDRFPIGGRVYTRADLNDDASARLDRCKGLRTKLAQTREQSKQLAAVLREGQETVQQAQQQEETLKGRLESLKTRIDHAQLRQRMTDLAGGLRVASPWTQSSTKVVESLDALEAKVRHAERQVEEDAASAVPAGLIDWEGLGPSRDARVSIDEYFDNQDGGEVAKTQAMAR